MAKCKIKNMKKSVIQYEVGRIYEKTNIMDIGDRYIVTGVKLRKHGDTWIYFKGVSGCIKPCKQSFMLGSKFDEDSILSPDQS